MKTIVINNQRGGVGKTTLAVHLAWYLAEADRRVLILDLDAQANATDTLARHAGNASAAGLPATAAPMTPVWWRSVGPRSTPRGTRFCITILGPGHCWASSSA
ncbi:MAG: ParA family protein [Methylocystis sp.]